MKKCIEFELITQEEIDMAKRESQAGKITEQEIEEARKNATKEKNEEKEFIGIDKEVVFNHLVLGYDIYDTRIRLGNIDPEIYSKLVKELIKEGRITEEEKEKYRKKKEEEYKDKILDALKRGISQRKIANIIEISSSRTQTFIKKIKNERNVSDEDIARWKAEQKDSLENRKKAVLEGIVKGLTNKEIVTEYPEQNLEKNDVKNIIVMLKKANVITNEEIRQYRREGREKKKKERQNTLTHIEEEVYKCLKIGLEVKEIANETRKSVSGVYNVIYRIKQKGKITNKEIKKARQNTLTHIEEEVYKCLKIGLEVKEIANETRKSVYGVYDVIYRIKQKGKITNEEIKKAREERKKAEREKVEREKAEKEKAEREKVEREKAEKEKAEREKTKRDLQIMQSKIKNDVNLNISLTGEKIDRIKEYINASYEFYDKERMSMSELAFIEKAIKKIPISEEELIRFAKACVKSQDNFRAFCMLQIRSKLDIEIESEEKLNELEQSLRNACKVERAVQMINAGNNSTDIIREATGLSKDKINLIKIKLSRKSVSFLNYENREKVINAIIAGKNLDGFYTKRGVTDFEKADLEEQAIYRRISSKKRDEIQEIRQDSKVRITALCTKLGLKKEITAGVIRGERAEKVEEYLGKALKGELINEDELQGIKILEDPFKEYKENIK